ncbi:AT-rich interactive domain-containing protein 4B-like, partial [Sinocyclocheilus grahami]|uniref:AT-rich interactive domain-containing protein 4B-like n=1 Tax=Sinocyclocheilus grahami TaxID=75366 RepID=UPI0007AC71D4
RSNPVQEEESSSSSSEEEEGDQLQNEELYGKVVCVHGVVTSDKKKTTWYPALVISPDCHEDVTLKKDNVFVRSFKDGKFYTVLRKAIRELDEEKAPKADAGLKPALDAAWDFQRNRTVPNTWRTEVKDESSSSEDDEEEEEHEEEASSEEEEVRFFMSEVAARVISVGTPINKRPVLGYRNLNLFKLYRLVHKLGGFDNIEIGSVWKQVYQDLGIPVLNSAAGYNVKCTYRKYVHPSSAPFPGRQEENAESTAPCEDKVDISSVNEEEEEEEEEDNHADEEESDTKEEARECVPTVQSPVTESVEEKPCEEPDDKDLSGDVSSQEWEEGEEFECYPPGMKVQVRYGRGHNQKTYEATVKESDLEGGEVLYLVHYCGWNVRYDEWIKADKIVRPANKNVSKIKHRKKIKNKAERERDRIERLTDREDLPSSKNRINRLSKPNSGSDVFSKMEECGDKGSQQTPVKPIEITSILNGLPGSESSTDESEREEDFQLRGFVLVLISVCLFSPLGGAAAHSSDSEDQCMSESTAKSPTSKSSSELKSAIPHKCSGRMPPSGHKYHKHADPDHSHDRTKWSFQTSDLEKMSSLERIAFLQEKLQDIRNHYLLLKSEVASIDRRRKRMKKKEREKPSCVPAGAAAASSSSSSSPSSSSLTAAVMLTLADPTVSGASQTSGVSVECR